MNVQSWLRTYPETNKRITLLLLLPYMVCRNPTIHTVTSSSYNMNELPSLERIFFTKVLLDCIWFYTTFFLLNMEIYERDNQEHAHSFTGMEDVSLFIPIHIKIDVYSKPGRTCVAVRTLNTWAVGEDWFGLIMLIFVPVSLKLNFPKSMTKIQTYFALLLSPESLHILNCIFLKACKVHFT